MKTCILGLLLGTVACYAQWADWEHILTGGSENASFLQDIFDNPLDLNTASRSELAELPWLSLSKAREIVTTRKKLGGFQSWDQLLNHDIFTATEIHFFQTVLTVSPPKKREIQLKGRHRLSFRKEKSKGNLQGDYAGNPFRAYQRIGFKLDNMQTGIVMEKDPGEASLHDFITGFLDIDLPALSARCLIGQFTMENGTGLHFSSPYRFGYSDHPIHNAKPHDHRLRPFLTTAENQGYLGVALQLRTPFQISLFHSQRKRAATLKNNKISSFYDEGYYRTALERSKRNAVKEKVSGCLVSYRFNPFTLSASFRQRNLSLPLLARSGLEYRGSFTGSARQSMSVYGRCDSPFPVFIEWVQTLGAAHALNSGFHWQNSNTQMILMYRHYKRASLSEYGAGLQNRSGNEQGIYWGILWLPCKRVKFSTYFDHALSRLPEARRPPFMPQTRWMGKIDVRLNPEWALAFRYKTKVSIPLTSITDRYGNSISLGRQQTNDQWRLALDGQLTDHFLWKIRLENHRHVSKAKTSNAILFTQSLHATFSAFRVITHGTLYDSPDFETRFYHYTYSVPGSFSLKMLYGRGAQTGFLFSWQPGRAFRLSLALTQTRYRDRFIHSSGLNEWSGETEHQIALQTKWQL